MHENSNCSLTLVFYVNITRTLTKFYQVTGPGVPGCSYVTDCKYGGPILRVRSPTLAVKQLDRLCRHTAFLKVCHHVLPLLHYKWCPGTGFSLLILCKVYTHVSVHICVHAKIVTGLRGNIFKFNLLHNHCTFLPFPSTLTSLYTPALSNLSTGF